MIDSHHLLIRLRCIWLLIAAVAFCGCTNSLREQQLASVENSTARSSKHSTGTVELTVTIQPATLRLSDEARLILEIKLPLKSKADFPNLTNELDEFTVVDTREPLPAFDGEFELIRREYQLQPKKAGKFRLLIPPVYFDSKIGGEQIEMTASADGQLKREFIEAESIDVEVLSDIAAETASLESMRNSTGPIQLTASYTEWVKWLLLAAVLLLVIGAAIIAALRARKTRTQLPLSARQLALAELQALIDSILAQTDCKLYYVELTAVVRRYIERSSGIRAPELTTDEFLGEISTTPGFSSSLKLNLKAFLESADLIKFAGQNPSELEVADSLSKAREFIDIAFDPPAHDQPAQFDSNQKDFSERPAASEVSL